MVGERARDGSGLLSFGDPGIGKVIHHDHSAGSRREVLGRTAAQRPIASVGDAQRRGDAADTIGPPCVKAGAVIQRHRNVPAVDSSARAGSLTRPASHGDEDHMREVLAKTDCSGASLTPVSAYVGPADGHKMM